MAALISKTILLCYWQRIAVTKSNKDSSESSLYDSQLTAALISESIFLCYSQVIASLNSDKDSLETALYEVQQTAAKLENRKEQLEAEVQELQLAKEAITGTSFYEELIRGRVVWFDISSWRHYEGLR